MAETIQLVAGTRAKAGKGAARAVRREGRVPAVIYGDKKDPEIVSFDYLDLWRHIQHGRFLATLVDIEVDGKKTRAIPRDIQFHPVRDTVLHVDFLRLGKGARITVSVPVTFANEDGSPGLTRGGVLNVVRYEIEVICPADAIPEELIADLTGLDIGDGVHISNITLPDGVVPTITDRDFTICTIAAPTVVADDEDEDEEDADIEGEDGAEGEEGEGGDGEGGEAEGGDA